MALKSDHRRSHPLSLVTRSAIASSLVLIAFFYAVGLILIRDNASSARHGLRHRLRNFVDAYVSATKMSRAGALLLPEDMPDARFLRQHSGLYAIVSGQNFLWKSPSASGHDFSFIRLLAVGQKQFSGPLSTRMGKVYYYSYGLALKGPNGHPIHLTFSVVKAAEHFIYGQMRYRVSLFSWLTMLCVLLVLWQLWLLRWSLHPVRKLSLALKRIEDGECEQLEGTWPQELTHLTGCINHFIRSEHQQRIRYRQGLVDMAHSLKTPLAVIRAQLESSLGQNSKIYTTLSEQVERMGDLITYQLTRASTSGPKTFAIAIAVAPACRKCSAKSRKSLRRQTGDV